MHLSFTDFRITHEVLCIGMRPRYLTLRDPQEAYTTKKKLSFNFLQKFISHNEQKYNNHSILINE